MAVPGINTSKIPTSAIKTFRYNLYACTKHIEFLPPQFDADKMSLNVEI
jgi:hypothetical protein